MNLLAQSATESFEAIELSLPQSAAGLLALLLGSLLLLALVVRTSLRDSRFLHSVWRTVLLIPRLVVFALLLFIIVNPSQRTQTTRVQKSRAGVLVDTSVSMTFPETAATSDPNADPISRSDAVRRELVDSDLLRDLSRTHAVSVYTFDSALRGPRALVTDGDVQFVEPSDENPATQETGDHNEPAFDWNTILQPQGSETRLGEALHEVIGQMAGRTLSGIVVITDGQSNAGLDPELARQRAERIETRIVAVGIGSPNPQVNLWVAGIQAPADVHRGDPFDVSVVVQSNGAGALTGTVELHEQSADGDGSDRRKIADAPFELSESGLPVPVKFSREIAVPGEYEYIARVIPGDGSAELTTEDNERRVTVEVTDRRMKVLVISSGPMREYRFVRNTLYRHTGIDSDVWLQTITDENVDMVSQEATRLLTKFPATAAELAPYNVIVAFDPDWKRLSAEQRGLLNRWVHRDAGGLILVAGELHTSEVARDTDELRDVAVLYPVVLNRLLTELGVSQSGQDAWPVALTPEGRASDFLQISDATGNTSTDLWQQFRGIYRSYPVRSVRDGAVVLARYENPRAQTSEGAPPFLATQFYGAGRTFFIGSAELWRLREISPEGYQRLWTSLIREVGQGSRQRGNPRGLILLDRTTVSPGQPVSIQARLYDARMEPLQAESVPLSIVDADGRPIMVPDRLRSDAPGSGRYSAVFRPLRPGNYRVSVPIPDSSDMLEASVEAKLSSLESQHSEQNVDLLTRLVENTGGRYLALNDAKGQLGKLLPDRSEPVVIDEQLRTLWDRSWLLYTLTGLLALEWALRRFMRLS